MCASVNYDPLLHWLIKQYHPYEQCQMFGHKTASGCTELGFMEQWVEVKLVFKDKKKLDCFEFFPKHVSDSWEFG